MQGGTLGASSEPCTATDFDSRRGAGLPRKARRSAAPFIADLRARTAGGRRRDRVRHLHRFCHQRSLSTSAHLTLVTINMQGWCWANQTDRHMAKALGMIRLARTHGWDAACLSDVHCPWEFTDDHLLPGAPRDLRNTVVVIEEFIVIFGTRSAILLSPAAQQAWCDHECHVARHECGRLLAVSLRIKGASYAITSVFAPDQSYGADLRRDFFELCDE
eukprot:4577742-Pyramimonas_sp.AAC.1